MRTVICEDAVTRVLDQARPQHPQLGDLWDALEWRIAKRPETGVPVTAQFYVYRQHRVKNEHPDLVILYEFDDHSVTIYTLRIIP
jgi:hypothetical protein